MGISEYAVSNKDKYKAFIIHIDNHVRLVNFYYKQLTGLECKTHDYDKFSNDVFMEYYYRIELGIKIPTLLTFKYDEVTNIHKRSTPHHPEYWEKAGVPPDGKAYDEMVCNWCATEYMKDNDVKDWYRRSKYRTLLDDSEIEERFTKLRLPLAPPSDFLRII